MNLLSVAVTWCGQFPCYPIMLSWANNRPDNALVLAAAVPVSLSEREDNEWRTAVTLSGQWSSKLRALAWEGQSNTLSLSRCPVVWSVHLLRVALLHFEMYKHTMQHVLWSKCRYLAQRTHIGIRCIHTPFKPGLHVCVRWWSSRPAVSDCIKTLNLHVVDRSASY